MLDIKFIADNTDWVKNSLGKKGFPAEKVDELLKVYYDMNKLKTSSQALAEEKNKLTYSIK
ncbi:MAG: serine--tRNA ligase, partial [Alphaproteobacteria bacterium]|nr:serine--tRNA ligase [Alphaproteobacteria bacterium]